MMYCARRELFYQDTDNSHAYVPGKNKPLRKTLDKKSDGTTVIASSEYELDDAGIRLSITDKDSKYTAWGYDPRYQVRSEQRWQSKTSTTRDWSLAWLYDANGNRLQQHRDGVLTSYEIGDNNEMLSAGADTFTYDRFGNTATKVSGGATTTYTWDNEGHMLSVDYPSSSADDTHEYDGEGRRMRSKLAGAGDWTNFVHDEVNGVLLAEYTLVSGTYTIKSLNTWGWGLISTNRQGTKRYFHYDGLGNTLALTDGSQVTQDTYAYSAFGVVESSSGSSVNPFRYVGQWGYYDDGARGSASGLLLLGVRYYSASAGRFWSWDKIWDINLYFYVHNSSVLSNDPSGLRPGGFAWSPNEMFDDDIIHRQIVSDALRECRLGCLIAAFGRGTRCGTTVCRIAFLYKACLLCLGWAAAKLTFCLLVCQYRNRHINH